MVDNTICIIMFVAYIHLLLCLLYLYALTLNLLQDSFESFMLKLYDKNVREATSVVVMDIGCVYHSYTLNIKNIKKRQRSEVKVYM